MFIHGELIINITADLCGGVDPDFESVKACADYTGAVGFVVIRPLHRGDIEIVIVAVYLFACAQNSFCGRSSLTACRNIDCAEHYI